MAQGTTGPANNLALSSRHILLLAGAAQAGRLALSLALDRLLPDYDTSGSLNAHICGASPPWGLLQSAWKLIVWDSVFFMRIACHGYEYEQQYAFFPLLSALVRSASSHPSTLAAAGLLITWVASTVAALLMAHLSLAITHQPRLSAIATILYIFNPASIFHTALYTEALFSCLSLLGLCILYVPWGQGHASVKASGTSTEGQLCRIWAAAVCFMLASATRSNGVVNAGYLLHVALQAAITPLITPRGSLQWKPSTLMQVLLTLGSAVGGAALTCCPLLLHQLHAHASFCTGQQHLNPAQQPTLTGHVLRTVINTLWLPRIAGKPHDHIEVSRAWCVKQPAWWPAVYGFVQKEYWDVGLLRYWRLSQLPNFLLAAPVLLLALGCIKTFVQQLPRHMLWGAFTWPTAQPTPSQNEQASASFSEAAGQSSPPTIRRRSPRLSRTAEAGYIGSAAAQGHAGDRPRQPNTAQLPATGIEEHEAVGLLQLQAGVFIYPLAFLTVCALLVMHVQVATRFLSSCPPLYWYAAHCLMRDSAGGPSHYRSRDANRGKSAWGMHAQKAFWAWAWGYTVLGAVLFSNFYPWT